MDILRKIHSLTLGNHCFEEVFSSFGIQELMNVEVGKLSLSGNVADDKGSSTGSVNQILLKLTIIHRMFSLYSSGNATCGRLTDICNYLVDNSIILTLTPLMDVFNQHIVYMATKAITSVLLYEPYLIKKYQLQRLFLDCSKYKWKAIYLMEMVKQLINGVCAESTEKNLREEKAPPSFCTCLSSTLHDKHKGHRYAVCINFMIKDWKSILSSYVPLWKDIVDSYMHLCTNKDFAEYRNTGTSPDKLQEIHMKISLEVHQKLCPNCIELSSKDEQNFLSLLRFLSALLKWQSKFQSSNIFKENYCEKWSDSVDRETSHVSEINNSKTLLRIIPVFAHVLQVKKLSSEVWKGILGLLSSCMAIDNLPKESTDYMYQTFLSMLSLHSAAAITSCISFGALDSIPLYNGFDGFGGEVISLKRSEINPSNVAKSHGGIFCQVSLLIIRASLIMLNDFQESKDDSSGFIFKVITTWCNNLLGNTATGKLGKEGINETKHCEILLEMFADQDDEMIEMMLLLLKLHKTYIRKETDDQTASIITFNPHLLFVEFLTVVRFDHSVLVDFLISSETVFLEYLMEYLRLVSLDWEGFCQSLKVATSETTGLSSDSLGVKEDLLKHIQETATRSTTNEIETSRFDLVGKGKVFVGLGCLSDISTAYGSDSDDDNAATATCDGGNDDDDDCGGCDDDDDDNAAATCDDHDGDDDNDVGGGGEDDYDDGGDDDCGGCDDDDDNAAATCDDHDDDNDVDGGEDNCGDCHDDCDDDGDYNQGISESQTRQDVEISCANNVSNIATNTTPIYPPTLEKTMSTLIHTRISTERLVYSGLFPYNASPLLRSLRTIESMYDGC